MGKAIDPDGNEYETPVAYFPTFGTFQHAPFRIFVEETKRACTCVICNQQIPKGEKRLKFLVKLPRAYSPGNGKGVVFQEKRFAHPYCLGIDKDIGTPLCYGCKEPRTGSVHRNPLWTNKRHGGGYLCDECAEGPRFQQCNQCAYYFPSPLVSPRIDRIVNGRAYNLYIQKSVGEQWVFQACKFCADNNDWETRQTWRKKKRDDERLELRFEELKRSLLGSVDSCQEDNQ